MTSYEQMKSNLLSQFKNAKDINAILKSFGKQLDEIETAIEQLEVLRWLENAEGKQLDGLGEIVDITRTPLGYTGNPLNDGDFKLIIGAKAIQNTWQGNVPGIIEIWNSIFSNIKLTLIDNQDMTMTAYLVNGNSELSDIQKDLIKSDFIIPRPAGVKINLKTTQGKVFGLGIENNLIGGFGNNWSQDLL